MIQLALAGGADPAEQWAFELLLDLARLLPAAGPGGLQVAVVDGRPGVAELRPGPGRVEISRAVLRRVVDLAALGREQEAGPRDRFGRVPSGLNPLVQERLERSQPVRELAEALYQVLLTAAGDQPVARVGAWPEGRTWAAAVTHDLDVVSGWPLFAALRWGELAGKGEFGRALRAMGAAAVGLLGSPVRRGIESILEIERGAGVRSTWFVLAGDPTRESWRQGDVTYRLEDPEPRRLVETIAGAGHEIGLHGSFGTCDSSARMTAERGRLANLLGRSPAGVRQHFLRFDPALTPEVAREAGFRYDASVGFADRTGFRLGTGDVITSQWRVAAARTLDLAAVPLVWMDRALSKYQGQEDPAHWVDDAVELAQVCRAAGGLWTGLWHPNVVPALGFPGALQAFRTLLERLLQWSPYIAPLAELVSWREARRGLRIALGRDGTPRLSSDRPGPWRIEVTLRPRSEALALPWPELHGG